MTVVDDLRALFEGRYGTPPGPLDPAVARAVALTADPESEEDAVPSLRELRDEAQGLASSEEELLLLGLFGEAAEPLLRSIRGRAGNGDGDRLAAVDQARAERIREVVRIVQESGIGEVTIEESGMRVSVRRALTEAGEPAAAPLGPTEPASASAPSVAAVNGAVRIESPMVGTFYRAPQPGAPPFVEVGDAVGPGQTLCILEAMKLMNEVKAEIEGIVRAIHVENAQPVEFGQLLFELEPLARPVDAV
jgi:oxaloacetate decarboxylase alpha subunit